MDRFQRILVPVDFSPCSREALEAALALGRPFGAAIEVLHVWTAPAYISPTLAIQIAQSHDTTTLEAMARAEASEQMSTFLAPVDVPRDVSVVPRIESGEVLDVLRLRAREHDVIVSGTHGRTGMSHLLLGSVAEKIVRLSEKPVLTVRHDPKRGKRRAMPPRRILVGVDFSACSKVALRTALFMRERFGAAVDVLHAVTHVPIEGAEILVSGYAGEARTPFREWATERAEEEMKLFLADLTEKERGEARVLLGDPVYTILEECASDRYDLLVIGTHGRTGMTRLLMGSVAERVVRRAGCPVLSVREGVA